jgi:hypothetical protein
MTTSEQITHLTNLIKDRHNIKQKLFSELSKAIVGQEKMLEHLTIALLANGHILLEGIRDLQKRWPLNRWHKLYRRNSAASSLHPICYLPM